MGRGRSGSTLLDTIVGNGDGGWSLGELLSALFAPENQCSCGHEIADCPVWSHVENNISSDQDSSGPTWSRLRQLSVRFGSVTAFFPLLFGFVSKTKVAEMRGLTYRLFDAVLKETGSTYLVDSSKEVTRALFLSKQIPNTKLIHIVRNGEQILASHFHRLASGGEFRFMRTRTTPTITVFPQMLLTTLGWVVGNLLCELVAMTSKERTIRIRYEDLVNKPIETIMVIEAHAKVDLTEVKRMIENDEEFPVRHVLAGNRIRMKGSVRLNRGGIKKELPLRYRFLFRLFAWPLLIFYRYPLFKA